MIYEAESEYNTSKSIHWTPFGKVFVLWQEEWRLINCDTLLQFERLDVPPTWSGNYQTRFCRWRCHSALKLENFTYLFSRRRNKIFRITIENVCNCRRAGKSVLKIFTSRAMCLNKFSFTRFTNDSSVDKWNLFSNLITRTMQWCWICTAEDNKEAHTIWNFHANFLSDENEAALAPNEA